MKDRMLPVDPPAGYHWEVDSAPPIGGEFAYLVLRFDGGSESWWSEHYSGTIYHPKEVRRISKRILKQWKRANEIEAVRNQLRDRINKR
jgi:hypothetical protein